MLIIICLTICIRIIFAADDEFLHSYYEDHFFIAAPNEKNRNAIKPPENKWPNGIIPYKFSDECIERDKSAILNAMEIFKKETCIRFVHKRSNHTEFIKFRKSEGGCGTLMGYRSNNTEGVDVMLSESCLKMPGAIQHELLHVIGLFHEQSRPDRDDFVTIYWENIEPGHEHNFRKASQDLAETFDFPYDFDSIMHYPKSAFSKRGTNYTIVAKENPERKLGQLNKPTYYDFEKVRRMYNCD